MSKEAFLHWAEVFDSWRVIPRTIIMGACWYVYHFTDILIRWYVAEPAAGRGIEESTALVGVITAITAVLVAAFKFYMDNGRDWTNPVPANVPTLEPK